MAFSILEQVLARRQDRVRRLYLALVVAAAVPLALGAYQMVAGVTVPVEPSLSGRIRGPFLHPNTLATFLAVLLVAAIVFVPSLRGRLRVLVVGLAVLAAVELVFTGGRSAWGGLLLAALLLGPRTSRLAVPLLVGAVVAALVVIPSARHRLTNTRTSTDADVPSTSFAWRMAYWDRLLPIAEGSPLLGIGPDGARVLDPARFDRPDVFAGRPPHSAWVESFVEMGGVGVAGLVAVVAGFAVTLRQRYRAARDDLEHRTALVAIGAAVVFLVQFPVENLLIQPVVWWYLAAVMAHGFTPTVATR
jgi:O-antigen ligase